MAQPLGQHLEHLPPPDRQQVVQPFRLQKPHKDTSIGTNKHSYSSPPTSPPTGNPTATPMQWMTCGNAFASGDCTGITAQFMLPSAIGQQVHATTFLETGVRCCADTPPAND
jgi:hypothetical protein